VDTKKGWSSKANGKRRQGYEVVFLETDLHTSKYHAAPEGEKPATKREETHWGEFK